MGFIPSHMVEEPEAKPEQVNLENITVLLKDINRPKQPGNLTILPWSGQGITKIGRWAKPLSEVIACDDLSDEEQAEAQQILEDMGFSHIHNGTVFFKRDDCPVHFRQYGTGDCTCEPK